MLYSTRLVLLAEAPSVVICPENSHPLGADEKGLWQERYYGTYLSFVRWCSRLLLYLVPAGGLFWRQNSPFSKQALTWSKYLQPEQVQTSTCQPNGWSCLFSIPLYWLEVLRWGDHGCHRLTNRAIQEELSHASRACFAGHNAAVKLLH